MYLENENIFKTNVSCMVGRVEIYYSARIQVNNTHSSYFLSFFSCISLQNTDHKNMLRHTLENMKDIYDL